MTKRKLAADESQSNYNNQIYTLELAERKVSAGAPEIAQKYVTHGVNRVLNKADLAINQQIRVVPPLSKRSLSGS